MTATIHRFPVRYAPRRSFARGLMWVVALSAPLWLAIAVVLR